MIKIINVDKNLRKTGEHEYEIRINDRAICRFKHFRENPLSECLQQACEAVKEVETRGDKKFYMEILRL